LREKITSNILRDGFQEGSFFKFSGGEKSRIEIATISGLQQLINFNTNSGGLDILMIDEILESVDGKGIQLIAKSANKLNKTIGLITHVNVPSESDYKIVTIEKRNQISKII
jgi:DNA repair exonuclease SbcCD ATPase subunit